MNVLLPRSSVIAWSLTVTSAFCLFFTSVAIAHAADILLSPSSGSYNNGQTFTVNVQVRPGSGEVLNAVQSDMTFDNDVLSVVSLSKDNSAFSLWTTEPAFSNAAGTISFGGGNTSPFSTQSTIVSITFRTTSEGEGTVSFGDTVITAGDGSGDNVFANATGGTYTISAAAEPEPTPEPEQAATVDEPADDNAAIAFGDPPRAPEVGSTAFLDPDEWYSITDGVFTWDLPFDVNAVAVEIATSSDNEPTEVFDPPIEEFVVSAENVSDGVQYLSVQYENQVGWGAVTNRKIQIDTTPPKPFDIEVQLGNSTSSFPAVVFEASDETSGIEYYELTIADREPVEVTPGEAEIGYQIRELEDGTYTITVTAYDKAGNQTVSTAPINIRAGWTPPVENEEERSIWSFLNGTNLIILVLVLITLAEFGYIIYLQREFKKKEELLRKETKEIQDQMEKIFSALRDEIYDQINTITKRPRLSKKEKEAVEGLNQALEVSETLIEKEINDVKKVLK